MPKLQSIEIKTDVFNDINDLFKDYLRRPTNVLFVSFIFFVYCLYMSRQASNSTP